MSRNPTVVVRIGVELVTCLHVPGKLLAMPTETLDLSSISLSFIIRMLDFYELQFILFWI